MKKQNDMKLIVTPKEDPDYPGYYIDLQVGKNTYSLGMVELNLADDVATVMGWDNGIAGDDQDPAVIMKTAYKLSEIKPNKKPSEEFRRYKPELVDYALEDCVEKIYANSEQIKAIDEEQKARDMILGRFFSKPVADGQAVYQITRISSNQRSAFVEYCDYLGDNWADHAYGNECWLPYELVAELIRCKDAMAALFEKKK